MSNSIKQLTCLRCGVQWWPRTPNKPQNCPKCNSPYWDRERVRDWAISKARTKRAKKETKERKVRSSLIGKKLCPECNAAAPIHFRGCPRH